MPHPARSALTPRRAIALATVAAVAAAIAGSTACTGVLDRGP